MGKTRDLFKKIRHTKGIFHPKMGSLPPCHLGSPHMVHTMHERKPTATTLYTKQESRPSPRKRNAKKAKWMSEEGLQIAVKRREAKSKGEKERYTHLKAEFQRIASRGKKAFLSNQCKEIQENNRMRKTRDLFKKIRDTKEQFMQGWA